MFNLWILSTIFVTWSCMSALCYEKNVYNIHAYMFIQVTNNTIHMPVSLMSPVDYLANYSKHNSFLDMRDNSFLESIKENITDVEREEYNRANTESPMIKSINHKLNERAVLERDCMKYCNECDQRNVPVKTNNLRNLTFYPDMVEEIRPFQKKPHIRSKRNVGCMNLLDELKLAYFVNGLNHFTMKCGSSTYRISIFKGGPKTSFYKLLCSYTK